MTARRMQRRIEEIRKADLDRIQREQRARDELEEHLRRLADELDKAVARTRPNPCLRPWHSGYESRTLIALRQATDAVEPGSAVDAGAIARRMQARIAEIRRQSPSKGAPARRPVSPDGGRKPFVQWLAEMSPQEVAALPPQKREMRRRWLEGNARGEVRAIKADWRPSA
jgi:hypothetical protein